MSEAVTARTPGPAFLAAEFAVLFLLGPLAIAWWLPKRLLIPSIAVFGLFALTMLLIDPRFDRRQLWNARHMMPELPRMLALAVFAMLVVTGVVWAADPSILGSLVRERPVLWAAIMIGYPLASVYPQEVIYRAFIFHRYQRLFPSTGVMIAVSAIAFGYAHIVLWNWLAVGSTLIGGLLFAFTYARTRSTAAAWIEHTVYGCFMFTVGLGQFFYGGATR